MCCGCDGQKEESLNEDNPEFLPEFLNADVQILNIVSVFSCLCEVEGSLACIDILARFLYPSG